MSIADFWNRQAKRYAASPINDLAAYEHKLAETRKLLRPDMQMVEFGCGTGSTAITHAPHVAQILALDVSQGMLDIAKSKIDDAAIRNITLRCTHVASANLAPNSADIILAMSLLHLLPDYKPALAQFYATLKPGGYFVSSTACISPYKLHLKALIAIMRLFGKAPLVRFFGADQLISDTEAAGFTVQTRWQPGPGKAMFVIARKPG